jgi:hypothetical protein
MPDTSHFFLSIRHNTKITNNYEQKIRRRGADHFVFVHYALILYEYQMAFSQICSAVYALGLVRLISRCYAVPQCSTHPNRCLLVPGLSITFRFLNQHNDHNSHICISISGHPV